MDPAEKLVYEHKAAATTRERQAACSSDLGDISQIASNPGLSRTQKRQAHHSVVRSTLGSISLHDAWSTGLRIWDHNSPLAPKLVDLDTDAVVTSRAHHIFEQDTSILPTDSNHPKFDNVCHSLYGGTCVSSPHHDRILMAVGNLERFCKHHKIKQGTLLHITHGEALISAWAFVGRIFYHPIIQVLLRFHMSGFCLLSVNFEADGRTPCLSTFHQLCENFLNQSDADTFTVRPYTWTLNVDDPEKISWNIGPPLQEECELSYKVQSGFKTHAQRNKKVVLIRGLTMPKMPRNTSTKKAVVKKKHDVLVVDVVKIVEEPDQPSDAEDCDVAEPDAPGGSASSSDSASQSSGAVSEPDLVKPPEIVDDDDYPTEIQEELEKLAEVEKACLTDPLDPEADAAPSAPKPIPKATFFSAKLGLTKLNRAPAKGKLSECMFCKDERLGEVAKITHNSLRFEYAWKKQRPDVKVHLGCVGKVPRAHWELSLQFLEEQPRIMMKGIAMDPELNDALDAAISVLRTSISNA
jgi:hypothetical protein